MKRSALVVVIASLLAAQAAGACGVTGNALNRAGQPLEWAVVRLVDLDSQRETFGYANGNNGFSLDNDGAPGQHVRVDLLGKPTVVTGSRIPTRSIIGQSDVFACTAGQAHQDVRAQID